MQAEPLLARGEPVCSALFWKVAKTPSALLQDRSVLDTCLTSAEYRAGDRHAAEFIGEITTFLVKAIQVELPHGGEAIVDSLSSPPPAPPAGP